MQLKCREFSVCPIEKTDRHEKCMLELFDAVGANGKCRPANYEWCVMWAVMTIVLIGLNLLDYQLTTMLVGYGGIEIEANPVAQWAYTTAGSGGMLLLKLVMVLATVRVIHVLKSHRRVAAMALLGGNCAFMLSVVTYNCWLVWTYHTLSA